MPGDRKNILLRGISLSPGLAMGKAFVFRDVLDQEISCRQLSAGESKWECARVQIVIDKVVNDLRSAEERVGATLDAVAAGIFDAHALMLSDRTILDELQTEIESTRTNAECVVQRVFGRWIRKLGDVDDDDLRQRAADFEDVGRRLLRGLLGVKMHTLENLPKGSVLVAEALLPSDTVFFPERDVIGILTVKGGPGSHCGLLTRQMGIPGVCQVPGLIETISTGDEVAIDGMRGRITVRPDAAQRKRFDTALKKYQASASLAREHRLEPAITADDVRIPVLANIGMASDAIRAAESGAEGVGLYRSELLFLTKPSMPDEEELREEMQKVLEPFRGRCVAVRLLDIGGDKNLPYLRMPHEDNPFLGVRGIRLLLRHRKLLRLQLGALLALEGFEKVMIIVPMVTFPEEMEEVRREMDSIAKDRKQRAIPELGPMIETPAAALNIKALCRVSEFFNIGTNDLTQYTMAAGRENTLVSEYFRHDHEIILGLVTSICRDAGSIPVGVCGELAGEWEAVPRLLSAGVSSLSVAPPLIPSIKEVVRKSRVGAPGE